MAEGPLGDEEASPIKDELVHTFRQGKAAPILASHLPLESWQCPAASRARGQPACVAIPVGQRVSPIS